MTPNHIHTLIDRFLAGIATAEEKEAMQQYFRQHGLEEETPQAGAAFRPDSKLSKKMYRNLVQQLQNGHTASVHRMNNRWLFRIAAVLIPLAFIGAGIYFLLLPSSQHSIKSKHTLAGIRNTGNTIRYLQLQDGTRIWLNKNAVLKLDTSDFLHNRQLFLEGEAYFDVTHDPAHPFVVSTGKLNTLVLGTAFSINSNNSSTTVTLFSGKVSLQSTGMPAQLLSPGQSGEYDLNTGTLRQVQASPFAIAWKTREVVCKNEKLESIIHYLQDYYGTPITISKSITGKKFSGILSLQGNISSVLNRLLFVHQLQHTKKTDGHIVIY